VGKRRFDIKSWNSPNIQFLLGNYVVAWDFTLKAGILLIFSSSSVTKWWDGILH
jgi:hypothetical protein